MIEVAPLLPAMVAHEALRLLICELKIPVIGCIDKHTPFAGFHSRCVYMDSALPADCSLDELSERYLRPFMAKLAADIAAIAPDGAVFMKQDSQPAFAIAATSCNRAAIRFQQHYDVCVGHDVATFDVAFYAIKP